MQTRKRTSYNSGKLAICNSKTDMNVKSWNDLKQVKSSFFKYCNIREQDYKQASVEGYALNLKVKLYWDKAIKISQKVVIDNILYSIKKIDYDEANRDTYLYLREEHSLC